MRLKKFHWAIVLAAEVLLLAVAAAAAAMSEWLSIVVSNIFLWVFYPLASSVAAYHAVRRGLNNYVAWIPGPVMFPAVYYLTWGYLASAGPMLLSALLGIIGAAAGETKNQFERRRDE